MATKWSRVTTVQGAPTTGSSYAASGVTPAAGDLMVCYFVATLATTDFSGASVADTGSNNWTEFDTAQINTLTRIIAFWKQATDADNNAGSGITVTLTTTGGAGAVGTNALLVDVYRVSVPCTITTDITFIGASAAAATSLTKASTVGSTHSSNTDELSWAAVGGATTLGTPGTCTFTGTSATANMAKALQDSSGVLLGEFLGGVQASATAATNVWVMAWGTPSNVVFGGATFVYTPVVDPGGMLAVMGP